MGAVANMEAAVVGMVDELDLSKKIVSIDPRRYQPRV